MMKTPFQSKRSRKRTPLIVGIVIIVAFAGIELFSPYSPIGGMKGVTHAIVGPFLSGTVGIREYVDTKGSLLQSKHALITENNDLRETLRESELMILDRKIVREENARLRALLNAERVDEYVYAPVLAAPNRSPYDTFILGAGAENGITEGDWVSADGVVALGRIVRVFDTTSIAVLFSAPGERITLSLPGGVTGEAIGRGAGNMVMRLPQTVVVKEGDVAIAVGFSRYAVARVGSIAVEATDSAQTVFLASPVNIFQLRSVVILRGTPDVPALITEAETLLNENETDNVEE